MNTQQAYINGFVKRAAEYGYSSNEAVDILKQALDGETTPGGTLDFGSRLKEYGDRASAAMRSAGTGIEKLTGGWGDLQNSLNAIRGKQPVSSTPPASSPSGGASGLPSSMLPMGPVGDGKVHFGLGATEGLSLGNPPSLGADILPFSPIEAAASKNSLLNASPVGSPAAARAIPSPAINAGMTRPAPVTSSEPSATQLARIMGSYDPRSRLDQAKAQRIRELFAQGKTSPNAIYADKGYSAITPQSLRR